MRNFTAGSPVGAKALSDASQCRAVCKQVGVGGAMTAGVTQAGSEAN